MNTTRFARYFALPIVSAGILGGAALGLASTASAASNQDVRPPAVGSDSRCSGAAAPEGDAGRALAPRDLPSRGPAAGLHPLINITEALPEELRDSVPPKRWRAARDGPGAAHRCTLGRGCRAGQRTHGTRHRPGPSGFRGPCARGSTPHGIAGPYFAFTMAAYVVGSVTRAMATALSRSCRHPARPRLNRAKPRCASAAANGEPMMKSPLAGSPRPGR